MLRNLSTLFLALCLVPAVVGCTGGGGEAKFDPSSVEEQSAEELQEAEDYEEMMKKQAAENEDSGSN